MMKKLTILLLTILLVGSCKTGIICSQIKRAEIDPLPLCTVSFKFNKCECRCFDLSNYSSLEDKYCGEDFVSGKFPIKTCEGISGFKVLDWNLEIKPKVIKLINIKENYCK